MEQGRVLKTLKRARVQIQSPAKFERIVGHTLRVASRVRVLRLQCPDKRSHGIGIRVLQLRESLIDLTRNHQWSNEKGESPWADGQNLGYQETNES
jgi:hypothetical protein